MKVPAVPEVPRVLVLLVPVLWFSGAMASRRRGRSCAHVAGLDAAAQDAAIEKFVASKGGTPIVENQTRLIFLVKDKDGSRPAHRRRLQRLGGDAAGLRRVDRQDDADRGHVVVVSREHVVHERAARVRASSSTRNAVPDPLNQRTVQAFAGPRSEVRMPFFVAQPEVDELGSAPKGELIAETFQSRSLGGSRRVWFYLPPGYAAATGHALSRSSTSSTARTTSRRWTCRRCSIT